jgi:hypothetical protein
VLSGFTLAALSGFAVHTAAQRRCAAGVTLPSARGQVGNLALGIIDRNDAAPEKRWRDHLPEWTVDASSQV